MRAVDTTFLIDYLTEAEDGPAGRYLERNESVPHYAPTLVLYEVYRGTLFAAGDDDVDDLAGTLEWLHRLPVTESSVREAVSVERELRADGRPINQLDVLIAGVVRDVGATLVTGDDHFQQVDDLSVVDYTDT